MKLTIFLLIITVAQLSAATSYAQKVTLQKNNASLRSVFSDIRNQTGYDFLGDAKLINQAKPVSVNIKDAPLEDALNDIFKNTDLVYTIVEKSIVIRSREIVRKNISSNFQIKVSGKVVNEQGKGWQEPLYA